MCICGSLSSMGAKHCRGYGRDLAGYRETAISHGPAIWYGKGRDKIAFRYGQTYLLPRTKLLAGYGFFRTGILVFPSRYLQKTGFLVRKNGGSSPYWVSFFPKEVRDKFTGPEGKDGQTCLQKPRVADKTTCLSGQKYWFPTISLQPSPSLYGATDIPLFSLEAEDKYTFSSHFPPPGTDKKTYLSPFIAASLFLSIPPGIFVPFFLPFAPFFPSFCLTDGFPAGSTPVPGLLSFCPFLSALLSPPCHTSVRTFQSFCPCQVPENPVITGFSRNTNRI